MQKRYKNKSLAIKVARYMIDNRLVPEGPDWGRTRDEDVDYYSKLIEDNVFSMLCNYNYYERKTVPSLVIDLKKINLKLLAEFSAWIIKYKSNQGKSRKLNDGIRRVNSEKDVDFLDELEVFLFNPEYDKGAYERRDRYRESIYNMVVYNIISGLDEITCE